MENIVLYSSDVYLSEENSNPDSYIAKFVICDFSRNKNGVALDRSTIEDWLSTLKNKPLVGKIKMRVDGEYDFTSHNMKKIEKVDENGNSYQEIEFDTDAFGAFFDVGIETINEKEFIVASCEIWKRFTKACEIIIKRIQEGNLSTSWEISVEKSIQGIVDGLMTKIIQVGRFIGHCLLGSQISPAYPSSGLLEIASVQYDTEFTEALYHDVLSQGLDISQQVTDKQIELKEDESLKNKDIKLSSGETPVDGATGNENPVTNIGKVTSDDATISEEGTKNEKQEGETGEHTPETSALTSSDLRRKISKSCRDIYNGWCWVSYLFPEEHEVWCEYDGESELDYLKFTYTVENDEVTVSEPEEVKLSVSIKAINTTVAEYEKTISEKDELIVKASSEITSLKSENTELSQYKEKFTKMEQEKVDAELAQEKEDLISYVAKSGQITKEELSTSEELSGYVNNLDKKSLMSIVGERMLSSMEAVSKTIETSEKKSETIISNLNGDDETVDKTSLMRKFLGK